MGKETKEMLKTINSNLEAIMRHLKIGAPASQTVIAKPKSAKKIAKAIKEKQKKK